MLKTVQTHNLQANIGFSESLDTGDQIKLAMSLPPEERHDEIEKIIGNISALSGSIYSPDYLQTVLDMINAECKKARMYL